jgi:hypothetical protein
VANYSSLAVFDINGYLWQKLQDAEILDKGNYYAEGFDTYLTPIIPAQQIPEFNNLLPGHTYIIYDYETKPTAENWWITEEILTYSVVSADYDKVNEILNFLQDTFRRYDSTAADLNLDLNNNTNFVFHYFYTDKIQSPQHFKNEGGFMIGSADICYSYVRKLNNLGRF